jgi:signal transduction histidine kinase
MNGLIKSWKLLITFVIYALVLAVLIGLDVRSPKLVLALWGIGFLISALFWEIWGGVTLGALTAVVTLPFLPAEEASLAWAAGLGVVAMLVGGAIGWANRSERRRHPPAKRPHLYPADVFQRALNPMLLLDPSGRVLSRNDRAVELLGSVKHLSEFIHIDDLERARAELERAISLGEAHGLKLRAVSWDKETLPAEIRMRKLTADQVWIEVRDLSDRIALERRLCETEARYRYLIEDAIDTLDTGIVLLDRDQQVIWANQTIGYLFHLDRDELMGVDLRRILTQVQPQMADAATPGRILNAGEESFVFTLRNGLEERILEFRSLPIETDRYRGGRIDHYIDLTEIKKLERELVEKTQRLEESNKKLEEFSHVVSHDLKQPLRTIQAFSQFLLEDYRERLDEQGMNYLQSLQRSSMRMKNLIDDLLKLASIGTKREPLEPVDVKDVLSEVHEDLGAALDGVELVCPQQLPVVTANRTRLAELFANLISNAVKYNEKAAKHVAIGWEEQSGEFVFYVRDNGMGIEERYRDRIFELFERLNPREDPESTGAGLAICKRIVSEMGGRIWVESEVGRGSIFYFSVPKRSRVLAPVVHHST